MKGYMRYLEPNYIFLSLFRMNPYTDKHYWPNVLQLFLLFDVFVLILLRLPNEEHNFELYATVADHTVLSINVISKMATVAFRRKNLKTLFTSMDRFWKFDEFDVKFQNECQKICNYVYFCNRSFMIYPLLILSPLLLISIIYPTYSPYFILYYWEVVPIRIFKLISGLVSIYMGLMSLINDTLLFGLLMFSGLQFKILNKKVSMIKFEGGNEEALKSDLNKCIKHQIFLYDYVTFLNETFSLTTATYFFTLLFSVGTEIIMMNRNPSLVQIIQGMIIVFTSAFLVLFLFYSMPSTYLSSKAADLTFTLYDMDWYCASRNLQKTVILMHLRSLKNVEITGGIWNVNYEACTEVLKKALSFYNGIKMTEN